MKQLFIKLLPIFIILSIFLVYPNSVSAGTTNVNGTVYYQASGTKIGLPNVWVKWIGEKRIDASKFDDGKFTFDQPSGNNTRYVKTDAFGKYHFTWWDSPDGDKGIAYSKADVDFRSTEFLTWIQPEHPEITPDTTAVQIYQEGMKSTGFPEDSGEFVKDPGLYLRRWADVVIQAQQYKPSGSGWVRKASSPMSGQFNCDNQPTISAITPSGYKGSWIANDIRKDWNQNGQSFGGITNDTGILETILPDLVFNPSEPINFNPTPTPVQSIVPASSTLPGASAQPNGTNQTPTSSNLSPSVDIWAASGVNVTGKSTPGGTLRVDPSQPFTLFWTAANASTCVASGNWAGIKRAGSTAQSKLVNQTEPLTTYTYTLTCFNNESGNQESDTVLVQIAASDADPFLQTTEGDVHSNQDISIPE